MTPGLYRATNGTKVRRTVCGSNHLTQMIPLIMSPNMFIQFLVGELQCEIPNSFVRSRKMFDDLCLNTKFELFWQSNYELIFTLKRTRLSTQQYITTYRMTKLKFFDEKLTLIKNLNDGLHAAGKLLGKSRTWNFLSWKILVQVGNHFKVGKFFFWFLKVCSKLESFLRLKNSHWSWRA